MWILEVRFNGEVKSFHLVGGCEYSIGRKNCDITIPEPDASVSRLHARILVGSVPGGDLSKVGYTPDIYISDESKHGTFVNGSRVLNEDARRPIGEKDLVVLGRFVELHLTYVPIVVCASENLEEAQYKKLQGSICRIGGMLFDEAKPQRELQEAGTSPLMFLFATNQVDGEPRALTAMMNRYVLVNPAYLDDIFSFFRDGAHLSLSLIPAPGHFEAMRNPLLADAPYFRPEPAIFQPNEFRTHPIIDPTSAFRGLHFLCCNMDLYVKYDRVLSHGGARCDYVPPVRILDWATNRKNQNQIVPESKSPGKAVEDAFQFQGLIGGPHVHGLNLIVLMPGLQFTMLVDLLSSHGGTSQEREKREYDEEAEAYLALWKDDKLLMHEENIHIAVYTSDAANQIHPTSPGILQRSAMQIDGPESDTDSQATEEDIERDATLLPRDALSPKSPRQGVIVVHEAQQVFASRSPPKIPSLEIDSSRRPAFESSAATQGAPDQFDLYKRWHTFHSNLGPRSDTMSATSSLRASSTNSRTKSPTRNSRNYSPSSRPNVHPTAAILAPVCIKNPRSRPGNKISREEKAVTLCNSFLGQTLLTLGPKVESVCSGTIKTNYLTAGNRLFLKTSLQRISSFTATLEEIIASEDIGQYEVDHQRVMQEARARCESITNAIEATAQQVGTTIPIVRGKRIDVEELVERQNPAAASRIPQRTLQSSPFRAGRAGSPTPAANRPSSPARTQDRGRPSTPLSRARSPQKGNLSRTLVLSPARGQSPYR